MEPLWFFSSDEKTRLRIDLGNMLDALASVDFFKGARDGKM